MNSHLYGKSKLGEDLLINLSLFAGEYISVRITIRSQEKAIQEIMLKEFQKCNLDQLLKEIVEQE